jgi:hypothetical protein
LRVLIPKALDVLAQELESKQDSNRLKAALGLLRIAQLPEPIPNGHTSADDILTDLVKKRIAAKRAERERYLSDTDRMLATLKSSTKEEWEAAENEARDEVLAELEERLKEN